ERRWPLSEVAVLSPLRGLDHCRFAVQGLAVLAINLRPVGAGRGVRRRVGVDPFSCVHREASRGLATGRRTPNYLAWGLAGRRQGVCWIVTSGSACGVEAAGENGVTSGERLATQRH